MRAIDALELKRSISVSAVTEDGKHIFDIIDEQPTIEPEPEIVRCKECINHGKEICYFWSHFYGTINTPDDGFCYKAERRTNNNDE